MKPHAGEIDASVPRGTGCPRLAYLLSSYPAISHTFFLNEIAELKEHGFAIDVASINRPKWEPNHLTDSVSASIATTFYIKGGKPFPTCLLLLRVLLTRPLVVLPRITCRSTTGCSRAGRFSVLALLSRRIIDSRGLAEAPRSYPPTHSLRRTGRDRRNAGLHRLADPLLHYHSRTGRVL